VFFAKTSFARAESSKFGMITPLKLRFSTADKVAISLSLQYDKAKIVPKLKKNVASHEKTSFWTLSNSKTWS